MVIYIFTNASHTPYALPPRPPRFHGTCLLLWLFLLKTTLFKCCLICLILPHQDVLWGKCCLICPLLPQLNLFFSASVCFWGFDMGQESFENDQHSYICNLERHYLTNGKIILTCVGITSPSKRYACDPLTWFLLYAETQAKS